MFIFSNLAISLDGKIATRSRAHFPLGSREDRRVMGVLRARADAVLMGAATLRSFPEPVLADKPKQPLNIVVSSALEGLSPRWEFFASGKTHKLVFTSFKASVTRVRSFKKIADVIVLDKPTAQRNTAVQIIEHLEKLKIRSLLVEGGGGLMWDFAKPNLIDEYYVTLTPRILGGISSPTLVDGTGFDPKQSLNLRLKECRQFGSELYLVYKKTGRRGP